MGECARGEENEILERFRLAKQNHLEPDTVESGRHQYLSFRLNYGWYGLGVNELVELLPVPKITRVPLVPDYLLGVINLRGKVLSVIDLKEFFALGRRISAIASSIALCSMVTFSSGVSVLFGVIPSM